MAGIKKDRWQERRERLLTLLPKYQWKVYPAAIEAGYSEYYAKTILPGILKKDISFCKRMDDARAVIAETTRIDRATILQALEKLRCDPLTPKSVQAKCLELEGKSIGMFIERQVIDDSRRQRELNTAEQEEARRLAILRFTPKAG